MYRVWIILIRLLATGLLLSSAATRPEIKPTTESFKPKYTIEGGSLSILSHPEYREFHYGEGIVFSGDGIRIEATELVVEVKYGDLTGRDKIKLPDPEPGKLERDPSGTAAELAREIYLPSPELTPEMLRMIRAYGGVTVAAENMNLTAAQLFSTDGGKTWMTSGQARLVANAADSSGELDLTADELAYNIETQTGRATGNIIADVSSTETPPATITANKLEFDALRQKLAASGNLKIISGERMLCCGKIAIDVQSHCLCATDNPRITDNELQLTITAEELLYNIDSEILNANGQVNAFDELHDASLVAEHVEYETALQRITATGKPRLTMGNNSYSGETLRAWREENGKLVVEVLGDQTARIDLSQMKQDSNTNVD